MKRVGRGAASNERHVLLFRMVCTKSRSVKRFKARGINFQCDNHKIVKRNRTCHAKILVQHSCGYLVRVLDTSSSKSNINQILYIDYLAKSNSSHEI